MNDEQTFRNCVIQDLRDIRDKALARDRILFWLCVANSLTSTAALVLVLL
jgi:hypothetical protein